MGCCSSNAGGPAGKRAARRGRSGSFGSHSSHANYGRNQVTLRPGKVSQDYYKCPNAWCLRTVDKAQYEAHRRYCDKQREFTCLKCGVNVAKEAYDAHLKNCNPVPCPTCQEVVIKSLLPHCPNVLKLQIKKRKMPETDKEAAEAIQRFVRGMKVTREWYAIIFRVIWFKMDRWDERGLFKSTAAKTAQDDTDEASRLSNASSRGIEDGDLGLYPPRLPPVKRPSETSSAHSNASVPLTEENLRAHRSTTEGIPDISVSAAAGGGGGGDGSARDVGGFASSEDTASQDDYSLSGDPSAAQHHPHYQLHLQDEPSCKRVTSPTLSLDCEEAAKAAALGVPQASPFEVLPTSNGSPGNGSASRTSNVYRRASLIVRRGINVQGLQKPAELEEILPYPPDGFAELTDAERTDHMMSLRDVMSVQKLQKRYAVSLLTDARKALRQLPNVRQVDVVSGSAVVVVGDIHGQLQDLNRILEDRGLPSSKLLYIFNGDLVDRGCNSCECLFLVLALFLAYPDYVVLNRGNHESLACTDHYGCHEEVLTKYSESMYELMLEVFDCMPLVAVVNDQVFVVHGGIPRYADATIEEINLVDRYQEIPTAPASRSEQIFMDIMWSDPDPDPFEPGMSPWEHNTLRDAGCKWRLPLTRGFCKRNNMRYIMRSHHPPHAGYETLHEGMVATVFSASNYTGIDSNHGAIAVLTVLPNSRQITVVYDTWKVYDPLEGALMQSPVPTNSPQASPTAGGQFSRTIQKWMGTAEESVVHQIREKVYKNLHMLMASFCELDTTDTGSVWKSEWADVMSSLIGTDIPWYFVRRYFAEVDPKTQRIQFAKFIRRHNLPVLQTLFNLWLPHTVKWLKIQCEARGDHTIETIFDANDSNKSGTIYYTEFFELITNRLGTLLNKDVVLMLYAAFDPQGTGYCERNEWLRMFAEYKGAGYILEVENWVDGAWESDSRQFIMWDFWLLQRLKKYFRKLPPQTAYRLLDRNQTGNIDVKDLAMTIEKMSLSAEGHTDRQKGITDGVFKKRVTYRVGDAETLPYVAKLFGASEETIAKGLKRNVVGTRLVEIQIWPLSTEQLEKFLSILDVDNDGVVSYHDFTTVFSVQDTAASKTPHYYWPSPMNRKLTFAA
eukprot:Rhum_TRINITY_DN14748_c4_g2::Rhum_TRINITY_DN14748_c4_g2_i1::g.114616::m.114616